MKTKGKSKGGGKEGGKDVEEEDAMWREKGITLQRHQPPAEGKSAGHVQGTKTSCQRRQRASMERRRGRNAREQWRGGGGMRRKKDTDGWKAAPAAVKEQQQGMRQAAV